MQAAPGQTLDQAGEILAWQHDPEYLGHGLYTFFDNESSGNPLLPYSRAITVRIDHRDGTATLIASDERPEGFPAASQGNAQTTGSGDLFVGWGALPYISEFNPNGSLRYNAEFPTGNAYRAYLLPWGPDWHVRIRSDAARQLGPWRGGGGKEGKRERPRCKILYGFRPTYAGARTESA